MIESNNQIINIIRANTTPGGVLEIYTTALELADFLFLLSNKYSDAQFILYSKVNYSAVKAEISSYALYELYEMALINFSLLLEESEGLNSSVIF